MIDNTQEEEQEEEQEIPVGVFVGNAKDLLRAIREMDRGDDVMEALGEYFENDTVEGVGVSQDEFVSYLKETFYEE
tara:strand:- start:15669 stop:15896 length:228 start_codon:yes stop_codon:yes gene_type:complete